MGVQKRAVIAVRSICENFDCLVGDADTKWLKVNSK